MDEAIESNQNDIVDILLEDHENNKALMVYMKKDVGGIVVRPPPNSFGPDNLDDDPWKPVDEFKELSKKHDEGSLYLYFLALIDLAAELCLNRNKKAIRALENIYPLDAVFSATKKENLDDKLKAKLVKLMLNLYVDRDPHMQLNLPGLTRVWNEISNEGHSDIVSAKEKNQPLRGLKKI
jgi:hypothetical protein